MDECEHRMPQALCVRCRDHATPSGLVRESNPASDVSNNVADHGICDTAVAAEEVVKPLDGLAKKTASDPCECPSRKVHAMAAPPPRRAHFKRAAHITAAL